MMRKWGNRQHSRRRRADLDAQHGGRRRRAHTVRRAPYTTRESSSSFSPHNVPGDPADRLMEQRGFDDGRHQRYRQQRHRQLHIRSEDEGW